MNEQLIIRLGSRREQKISWLVWQHDNSNIIASGEITGADELPALAERLGTRQVVALVPASDVVLKQVTLPGKPNRQLLQALPYMLEEEQAEDIDQLWIAIADASMQEGQYLQNVAVCQRQRLESWLNWLSDAGFNVVRMLPDALLLPVGTLPGCIQLHNQWLLKQDSWQATAVDAGWWSDYLALAALPELVSYSPWPENIPQSHTLATPELPLALLAGQLNSTPFNLLQGEYKPKKQQKGKWQAWYGIAALVAVCVGVHLVNLGLDAWQLSRQTAAVQQQIRDQYQQAFPEERIVNLPQQLRQKLSAVDNGQNSPHFLQLLQQLQQTLVQIPDIALDNLRYDAKRTELRFQARGDGFPSFEKLKLLLEQQHFIVEQGALSNDGAKVQGTVSIRSGT